MNEDKILKAGEYTFTVLDLVKGRYQGGEQLPACTMVDLQLHVFDDEEYHTGVEYRLYLHPRMESQFLGFFKSIGQYRPGEWFRPDWDSVTGSTGRCKIDVRIRDGEAYNEIVEFLDYDEEKCLYAVMTPHNAIKFLESKGFQNVMEWNTSDVMQLAHWIILNNWTIPFGVNPETYSPRLTVRPRLKHGGVR